MSKHPAAEQRERPLNTPRFVKTDEEDLEAGFVYARGPMSANSAIGHVDEDGDVFDGEEHKVGHVMAAVDDVGEIFRGYDERLGYVRVTPKGDGYVYADGGSEPFLLGIVTAQGDVYTGHGAWPVGTVQPPLDAERMGAAALLLGLL